MRPQQQGRRQRNRNSGGNNRRNQNPLQRNYESNGPDVKIRGNAQVIADKYATLARDAQSSGDTVMAENYLQHAEHYNRIILAAQAQMQAQREERQQQSDDDDGDDNSQDNRSQDNRSQDNRSQDNRSQDNRSQDNRSGDNRSNDNRQNENRASDGNSEGRSGGRRNRKNGAGDGDAEQNRDASQEPQPVIDDTPVEVRLEEQEQTEGKSRRSSPRRARKPRQDADDSSGESKADDGKSEAAVAEA